VSSLSPAPAGETVASRKARVLSRLRGAGAAWVTAAELAGTAGVTTRSIRTYVNEINRAAGRTAIESTSLGYRLLSPRSPRHPRGAAGPARRP